MTEEWVIKAQRVKELVPSKDLPHVIELAKKRLIAQQKFVTNKEVVNERINRHLTAFDLRYNGWTLDKVGKVIGKSRERTRQLEAKMCRTIMKCYKIYKRSQKNARI